MFWVGSLCLGLFDDDPDDVCSLNMIYKRKQLSLVQEFENFEGSIVVLEHGDCAQHGYKSILPFRVLDNTRA